MALRLLEGKQLAEPVAGVVPLRPDLRRRAPVSPLRTFVAGVVIGILVGLSFATSCAPPRAIAPAGGAR